MSTYAATVARQLAALEATLRPTAPGRVQSDEEIAHEMRQEQAAEGRKWERQQMSDWTARRTA